ncbi:MAG: ATP-binding protein [Acidimicrobiia bacterium]
MTDYRTRLLDTLLEELLRELPALFVVGPRATGKTTTAARHAATIVQLDRAAQAAPFEADPDAALRELDEPILLDEWQIVPAVLGAVKRAVDSNRRPGRFLLTGSVRADIDAETWPATGRVVRVDMYPLTVAEQVGSGTRPLADRLVQGEELSPTGEPPDLRGYVELALQGGFPEVALGMSGRARERWLDSYVDQLLTRDALNLESGRDPQRLGRFFEAYALNSAGLVEDKAIYEAAGINRKTAVAYAQLLKNLLVIDELPSWTSNRLKRLARSPKRYLIDSALLGGVVGVDAAAVLRDGDLLGRLLDTFVVAQLRAEATVAEARPRMYHLRQEDGRHEVDIVAEIRGGAVIGIEVKASSAPTADAARHLAWLRDHLGDTFIAGAVLHTGPATYSLGEKLVAAPICTLWS